MRTHDAELVWDCRATLGEGPIWDPREAVFWWIDINERRLHRFDPSTRTDRQFDLGQRPGTVVPRSRGGVLLAVEQGFASFDPADQQLQFIADPEAHLPGNRFNDGKCDPAGRLWAGTMQIAEQDMTAGSLYCLNPDHSVVRRLEHVGISNGIVWSLDGTTMYYIDSPTRRVDAFDFELASGAITNRRAAVHIPEGLGYPDGMAMDALGRLWVALWAGWGVACFDPVSGCLQELVRVPAKQVTACAFGGPELRQMLITTARRDLAADELPRQPFAGGLFAVDVGVAGAATHPFAG